MEGGTQAEGENCAVLGYYTAGNGSFSPTFQDSLSVPSSGVKNPKESQYRVYRGKNVCSEMSH